MFPLVLRKYLESTESSCCCVQWSHREDGSALVFISDNEAFSKLYGYRKSVWAKQFNVYGFKNYHKGSTQKQKAAFTYYYHGSFKPCASMEQLKAMRKRASCPKTGVCFAPSGPQFLHVLKQKPKAAQQQSQQAWTLQLPSLCSFENLCWKDECDPLHLMRSPLMTPVRRKRQDR